MQQQHAFAILLLHSDAGPLLPRLWLGPSIEWALRLVHSSEQQEETSNRQSYKPEATRTSAQWTGNFTDLTWNLMRPAPKQLITGIDSYFCETVNTSSIYAWAITSMGRRPNFRVEHPRILSSCQTTSFPSSFGFLFALLIYIYLYHL